ncbi:MAG: glycosyltransferase family 2 protein [Gammaproteobacteria bacterium]|nr:glycosyltransferase family 2 protein [Gammaproteobacteria bacterium]
MTQSHSLFNESDPNRPILSIIIPVFNERDVLPLCLPRLNTVIQQLDTTTELIFIDDGSCDGSAEYLTEQVAINATICIIRLSRNFGKEAALTAGLDHAKGDAIIILDADLQDPPELIPEMLKEWRKGRDIVLMQRRSRAGESWFKRTTAYLFYRFLHGLTRSQIPADTGDFRLMSRRAVEALKQLPERNRFMKGLFAWIGMPTVILKYDRNPRAAGTSKWDYLGLLQLALEGITSFSISPLRWVMGLGMIAAFIGGAFGLWIVFKAVILGDPVHGYPSLVSVITFLGGIQLIAIGILGEYVGKTYIETKQRPNYLIRDITYAPEITNIHSTNRVRKNIHAQAS